MWLVVAAALFAAIRPYSGIRHDGALYVAQALKHIDPTIFSGDIFFKYGSQDSFSIFGQIYALAIVHWGFASVSLIGVMLGQFLFVGASAILIWRSLLGNTRFLALLLLAVSAGTYGSSSIFHVAEPFLTARTYAEVLVVFAVSLLLGQRIFAAAVICVVAALLHPLMALPGLFLCGAMVIRQVWGRAALIALCVLGLLLAYIGIAPFDRAFLFYDDEWRGLVDKHNFVFMASWPFASWLGLFADLVLLAALAFRQQDQHRSKLLKALFGTAIFCLSAAFLGSDVLSNVLVTSLQLWRVQWLVHIVALVFLAPELVRAWSGSRLEQLAAVLLVYAVLFQDLVTGSLAMLIGLSLLYIGAPRRWHLSPFTFYFSSACLLLAVGYNWWKQTTSVIRLGEYLSGTEHSGIAEKFVVFLQQAPVGPLLVALVVVGLIWSVRRSSVAISVILIGLLFLTATNWDRRPEITKLIENTPLQGPHAFADVVPVDAEVYWQGDALAPWLLMHRRSYASGVQAAGLVFNRGTAIELDRRRDVTSAFDVQREICGLLNALRDDKGSCEPDVSGLELTCEADPQLGYIVMPTKLEGWVLASWTPGSETGSANEGHLKTYYLYGCAELTKKTTNPKAADAR